MSGDPLRLLAMVLIGANVALALWLLFRQDARWAMALWALALFFTPVYLTVSIQGIALTVLDVVTIIALASSVPTGRLRWTMIDTLITALFVTLFVGLLFGAVPGHVQYSVMSWLLPYAWGRVVIARVGFEWVASCIGIAAVVAAVLAIIESLTGTNIFLLIPGVQGKMWTALQYRGGLLRSEGAFGHSISLGSSLALATAFLMATRWRLAWKIAAIVIVALGAVVTISRIGLVGILLVVLLSTLFLGRYISTVQRGAVFGLVLVGALIMLPTIAAVFDDAGDEAAGSAEYRGDLIPLLREAVWIGISPGRELSPDGTDYFGGFRSIDSALILIALRHGLLPLILILIALGIAVCVLLSGRGNPAVVAVLSQVPALATVALITQYASFLWFVAGVAVASYSVGALRGAGPAGGLRARSSPEFLGVS